MIENWRDLVGYHLIPHDVATATPFYLKMTQKEPDSEMFESSRKMLMSILKGDEINLDLTEEQLCEQLDAILTSFPESEYDNDDLGKKRAANQVARQTYRGPANTEYKNSIFYRSENWVDAAVIVMESKGRYGIFKHPDFDKYGFGLKNV